MGEKRCQNPSMLEMTNDYCLSSGLLAGDNFFFFFNCLLPHHGFPGNGDVGNLDQLS